MKPPLIRIHDLCKSYSSEVETVWAARDVSFEARPGQFVCVYGASGSGKSTLLNMIAGLDVPDSGDIQVGDAHVSEADEKQRAGEFRQWKHLPRRVRRISRRASSNCGSYGVGR